MNTTSLKVGDRVGMQNQYSHFFGQVIKITATGQITVRKEGTEKTERFDSTGLELGAGAYLASTMRLCDAVDLEKNLADKQARLQMDKLYNELLAAVAEAKPRCYNDVNVTAEWLDKVGTALANLRTTIK